MPDVDVKALQNRPACHFYLHGKCNFSAETCAKGRHDPRLDPKLFGTGTEDFRFSTKVGQACGTCLQRNRDCDKLQRTEAENDPCSECRQFGAGKCQLARRTSHNDVQFRIMLNSPDYTLPDPPSLEIGTKRVRTKSGAYIEKPHNAPLPDDQVMANWTGVSRDELLKRPCNVPEAVRKHPRAYLQTPESMTSEEQKHRDHKMYKVRTGAGGAAGQQPSKRPLSMDETSGSSHIDTKSVELPFARVPPKADPIKGRPTNVAFNYSVEPNTMTVTWEHGRPETYDLLPPPRPAVATSSLTARPKGRQPERAAKKPRVESSDQSASAGAFSVANGQPSTAATDTDSHMHDTAAGDALSNMPGHSRQVEHKHEETAVAIGSEQVEPHASIETAPQQAATREQENLVADADEDLSLFVEDSTLTADPMEQIDWSDSE